MVQTIIVIIIVAAALLYVGRTYIRSFKSESASSCGCGSESCEFKETPGLDPTSCPIDGSIENS